MTLWLVLNGPRPIGYQVESRRRRAEQPNYEPWKQVLIVATRENDDAWILHVVYDICMLPWPDYEYKVNAIW
jgi:hypothetical protein